MNIRKTVKYIAVRKSKVYFFYFSCEGNNNNTECLLISEHF